jgi:glycosyltransferase involved in cell wall biosynthesis
MRRVSEEINGEIVLVVDGQPESGVTVDGAILLSTGRRSGPAAARNLGASVANSEVFFFVDSDVIADPAALKRALSLLEANPNVAGVFGSYDAKPSELNFISQYRNLLHHFVHQASNEEAFTFWAGCGAIRKNAFHRVGGFNERFVEASVEDIELGSRIRSYGERLKLCKQVQVTHRKRWTLLTVLHTDIFRRAVPWSKLILHRRVPIPNDLNLNFANRVSVLLVALQCALLPTAMHFKHFGRLLSAVELALLFGYLVSNFRVLAFFLRIRGAAFAVKTAGMMWLHHFCCLVGMVVATSSFLYEKAANLLLGTNTDLTLVKVAQPLEIAPVSG